MSQSSKVEMSHSRPPRAPRHGHGDSCCDDHDDHARGGSEAARWLVALLVRSWFRRSEVARLVMGDFHRDPHGDGWVCTVETKGGQDHTIVVTSQLLRELQVYRVSLGLSALPLPHDTLPAVGHLSSRDRHLTADMVYKIVKDLVKATADRLASSEPAGEPEVALMVERLRSVSPH